MPMGLADNSLMSCNENRPDVEKTTVSSTKASVNDTEACSGVVPVSKPVSVLSDVNKGCPVKTPNVVQSLPLVNLSKASREALLEYFENTWNLYETMMGSLKDEDTYYIIANPLRRPLIFYLGHTAVLYVNKLVLAKVIDRINPAFERLFETGVDEMSWDDDNSAFDGMWPSVKEVWEYRRQVHEKVVEVIKTFEYTLPITMEDPLWALVMGFEHERIHFETSAILIRELPVDRVVRPKSWTYAPTRAANGFFPKNEMIEVPAGTVEIGKPHDFPSFGWDNEYGKKVVHVAPFKASKFLITNGEFLEFVQADGYSRQELWDDEGWRWATYRKAKHPVYWIKSADGSFKYRATFDVIEMPWDWPVDVNYLEAKAYCRWKGPEYRVITEAEHHRLREPIPSDMAHRADQDAVMTAHFAAHANLNMRFGSASPVDLFPPNSKGFHDVFGNVWEWTEDHFHPLPGFRIHALYDDFSTPCFDNRHNMMMGSSWVSTGDEASRYARFHFRRHFHQNLGFRLVTGDAPAASGPSNTYESAKSLNEYLLFHYGDPDNTLPPSAPDAIKAFLDFPVRCAQECIVALEKVRGPGIDWHAVSAFDIGCAVGRSSFELARMCGRVVGTDFSARFVGTATKLKETGSVPYMRVEEGAIETAALASIDASIQRDRVRFFQGDACNLPPHVGAYDIVLMANLIDRLHHPLHCIRRLPELVKPNGICVITSPYTWLEEYTQHELWLGGVVQDGRPVSTFEALQAAMEAVGFRLLYERDLPFILREHRRKFQFTFAHATAWVRL